MASSLYESRKLSRNPRTAAALKNRHRRAETIKDCPPFPPRPYTLSIARNSSETHKNQVNAAWPLSKKKAVLGTHTREKHGLHCRKKSCREYISSEPRPVPAEKKSNEWSVPLAHKTHNSQRKGKKKSLNLFCKSDHRSHTKKTRHFGACNWRDVRTYTFHHWPETFGLTSLARKPPAILTPVMGGKYIHFFL